MNAIAVMCMLTQLDWNDYVYHSIAIANPSHQTEVGIGISEPTGRGVIKVQHMVLALYETGVAIAQQQKFCKVLSKISLDGREIGWIRFQPKEIPIGVTSYLSTESIYTNSTVSVTAKGDTGRVVDFMDQKFYLKYTWDGVKIKSQDLFTAMLNALAISAPFEDHETHAHIPALVRLATHRNCYANLILCDSAPSASGDVTISTWLAGGGAEANAMNWDRLRRVLEMIWENLIIGLVSSQRPRFEGLYFEMYYDETKLGAGRILKFDETTDNRTTGADVV